MRGGKKVPPFLQKFRANDLLAAAFPETVGCLENHHGDVEIPDHPLVQQTMRDCLHEAMDVDRWVALLGEIKSGAVKLIPFDSREPSPFSHQLLNAAPYAFLDDAPLEERRTRAISTRRTLAIDDFQDLAKLDAAAIDQVASEAWPLVRDAEELHDALQTLVLVPEADAAEWRPWFRELVKSGRACEMSLASSGSPPKSALKFLVAAERLPYARALHATAVFQPEITLPTALDMSVEPADARLELVRGWMEHSGPVTADELAAKFQLPAAQIFAALESVEASGLVLRGQFRSPTGPPGPSPPPQFCNRRLLARIHRLTLDGLRRRIQPVMPVEYVDFLTRWHRLVGEPREGELGLRDALAQLQGFELPAGAWEKQVLAPRLAEYDPQWLDRLFLSGEAMWGRLRPPKRQEKDGPGIAVMTRTMPMSLLLREDLPWLLPEDRADVSGYVAGNAHEAHCVLQTKGALFFADLRGLSGLLPTQLEDALRELAAFGLITSDTFAAVRSIVGGSLGKSVRFGQRVIARHAPAGRWSLFPGYVAPIDKAEYRERWCRQLLARYGVLFRDLLTREYAAPSWYELAPTLRRMELRGEVRGGRFVSGVAGEQFALESAVTLLRETRDSAANGTDISDDWCVISAADPLNLTGILTKDRRITASHKSSLILQRGKCVAAKESGRIVFFEQFSAGVELAMRRALQTGMKLRRREPPLTPALAAPLPPLAN
jgi:ATP-dependent Lhr-like helicase